jgi:short-subunit dehydrogenase
MIEKREGEIINVSSMASFQGLPFLAVYAATKAFVTSFSLALASELSQYNIKVQALCPGPVQTEFVNVSGFPDKISVLPSFSAHDVAVLSLKKLKSTGCYNSRIVIPGFMNCILAQLNRLLPRYLATDIAMKVLKKKFKK